MAEENNKNQNIIPANDAMSIHGMEVISDGKETEVGILETQKENDDEAESEEEDNLLLPNGDNEPVLLRYRQFKIRHLLNLTGNFSKAQCKSKYRYLYTAIQVVIVVALAIYLMFTFGWIQNSTRWPTLITSDGNLLFTKVHDVIWEQKWFLTYVAGLVYQRSGHFQWLFSQTRLPRPIWKKSKRHLVIYAVFVSIMVIIAPTLVHSLKIYNVSKTHHESLKWKTAKNAICTICYLLFRLLTVPSFCAVTCVLYLIKVMVDELGRTLKNLNVNLGTPYALREIRNVKKVIRRTDTRLKWYLILHLSLILITAFTGLFSLLEQIEFKIAYGASNQTTIAQNERQLRIANIKYRNSDYAQLIDIYTNIQKVRQNISKLKTANSYDDEYVRIIQENKYREKLNDLMEKFQILALKDLAKTQSQIVSVLPARNVTVSEIIQGPAHFLIQMSKAQVLLTSVAEFAEVVALFLVPLLLLAWQDRAQRRITDEIYDLDEEDQGRRFLLINSRETKDAILEVLRSMRPVSIFGMQVSLYKTAFIAVLAPFMTASLHAIFKQFRLY